MILGQGYANGEAPAIGRVAALDAGLGVEVPGMQLDRRCGAGLQAIVQGAMQVQTGASELVLAGGAESMSQAEFYAMGIRWGVKGGGVELADRLARPRVTAGGFRHVVDGGMIETAENVRRDYGIIARRAGRARAALARARSRRSGRRYVRRGDRAGQRDDAKGAARDRSRRASSRRHDAREARRAAADHGSVSTPRRPSRPATPAARTTALPSASSRIPRRLPSSA